MNRISFFVFFAVVTAVFILLNFYVYHRTKTDLKLSVRQSQAAKILFSALGTSFFIGVFLFRRSPFNLILAAGSVWLGILSLSVSVFAAKDLLSLLFTRHGALFSKTAFFLLPAIILYSIYNGLRAPAVHEIEIFSEKVPDGLDGFSIVQLSDLHLGYLKSSRWFEKVVENTVSLKPDLILITGDLIDRDICGIDQICGVLRELKAPDGVFAVTGNHEFYSGASLFETIADRAGFTVLRNNKYDLHPSLELIGVDDKTGKSFGETGTDLEKALKGSDSGKFRILLSHQPGLFTEAARKGIDLQLSGHTHAGQIPPLDLIVFLAFKYPCGLYKKGTSTLYTTTGTGTWGPPMRLFSRSKIVKITLRTNAS